MNEAQIREEIHNLHELLRHVHTRLRVLERTEYLSPGQTTPAPVAQGDVLVADSDPEWGVLTLGGADYLLKVNSAGTDPAWEAFDWDAIAAAAGADVVHTHQNAGEGGQVDHGAALTGLGDDDHTQYLLASGTRTGASSQKQQFSLGIRADGSIDLYYSGTLVGQLSAQDTTWFRLNQGVAKNIYTPRYLRADGGLAAGNLAPNAGQIRATGLIETTTDYFKSTKCKRAKYRMDNDLTLASNDTWYQLDWDTEVEDEGGFSLQNSNKDIVCPEVGTYLVIFQARCQIYASNASVSVRGGIDLGSNTVQLAEEYVYATSSGEGISVMCMAVVQVDTTSTDVIKCWVKRQGGTSSSYVDGNASDYWTTVYTAKLN
jgi:hypothetical protein